MNGVWCNRAEINIYTLFICAVATSNLLQCRSISMRWAPAPAHRVSNDFQLKWSTSKQYSANVFEITSVSKINKVMSRKLHWLWTILNERVSKKVEDEIHFGGIMQMNSWSDRISPVQIMCVINFDSVATNIMLCGRVSCFLFFAFGTECHPTKQIFFGVCNLRKN